MAELAKLKKLNLRDIWSNEASDFTPWLAENIRELGEVLGMDLELEAKEASVGDFSLDLLARDLGSDHTVIIENQLTQTDHDHLGKLLTYAAGFDASVVIWLAESIREEHRQALDWLNQRTDTATAFFGMVVEVLQIDDSKPAYNFKPVVFPNEWQKSKRIQMGSNVTPRGKAYRDFWQVLIDELREKHKVTSARVAQPQNWFAFSAGVSGVNVGAVFGWNNKIRVEIFISTGDLAKNKLLFDYLQNQKELIEKECAASLDWERQDEKSFSRIAIYRNGNIEGTSEELDNIRRWLIEWLPKFKNVFGPHLKAGLK